ncbi:MAG: hypothetical protein PHO66_05025 [Eubacteriales bacterium]|nr:hypothetical protein [Eubacteriales bacterium]
MKKQARPEENWCYGSQERRETEITIQELSELAQCLEQLENGRKEKVEKLTELYLFTLRQNIRTYEHSDEIMRLSTEVDSDMSRHYALRNRMRQLINRFSAADITDVK